jgi:hypothetical protein
MSTQTFTNRQLEFCEVEERVPRMAQACFKWAGYLQACRPVLMAALVVGLAMFQLVVPTSAQTTGPLITGNSNSVFVTFRTLVQIVTFALVFAGICGVAWALINGMRRHAWGAQLGFGLGCLGFSGIVALLSSIANGDTVDIPR